MSEGIAIKKNTKVICPLCGAEVGKITRNVKYGEVMGEDNLEIYDVKLKKGDYVLCPKCGFPLAVETVYGTLIHTEEGWDPLKIPTGALIPYIYKYMKEKGLWKKDWDKYLRKTKREESQ